MKATTHLIAGCLLALTAFTTSSFANQLVELRLVLDKPSADAEQMTLSQNGGKEVLLVEKTALIDQTDLKVVAVSTNMPVTKPQVGLVFEFTDKGAKHFALVTKQNKAMRLAVVVDGQIISAPVIKRKISDGIFEFHGPFTEQQACDLSVKINKVLQR